MTDQKLVDELEKALRDEAYDGGFGYMGDEQFTAYVRTLAETAAEVFEKVLTPTDDERGWAEYRDATPGNNTPEQRRAFFAALGRSEVPEPSGDEREAVRLRAALEDVWSTIQRDVRVLANLDPAELGGIVARAIESSRSEPPEPSRDDEREALVAILEAPLTEESQGRTFSEMLADVILARYGFRDAKREWSHCSPALLSSGVDCASTPRRPCSCSPSNGGHDHLASEPQGEPSSEVPEPSTEVLSDWFTSSHGVAVAAVKPMTDRGPSVMVDGRVISPNDVAALIEFKAQGEPSDAVIVDMLTAFYGEERDGWSIGKVRRMRAALRAAGGVR